MRTGTKFLITAVAGAALALTGCGSKDAAPGSTNNSVAPTSEAATTTSKAASGDEARVAFVDGICGSVEKFITPAKGFKPDTSSPANALKSIRTQLGTMSAGLDEAVKDLDNVPTAGVPDGKAGVDSLKSTLTQMKETVDKSTAKLNTVNANDAQAVGKALQDVGKDLQALGKLENPLAQPGLKSAEMDAAAEKAPKCKELKGTIGTKTTTKTS